MRISEQLYSSYLNLDEINNVNYSISDQIYEYLSLLKKDDKNGNKPKTNNETDKFSL